MTLGIRDTRKIEARLQPDRARRPRAGRGSTTRSGSSPSSSTATAILILPTTGRYFQVPYRALRAAGRRQPDRRGRCIGGDKVSHAAIRNMMCCTVSGQGAGVAAADLAPDGEPFDRLDVARVQAELLRQASGLTEAAGPAGGPTE